VLADRYEGKRLNSPNDLVYRKSDGSLYFTDPPHGLPREDADPAKELPFNGVYRLAGGKLQLVIRDMTRPNGIAFSPDERFLYVSNSDSIQLLKFLGIVSAVTRTPSDVSGAYNVLR
jgi:gluconolactonase